LWHYLRQKNDDKGRCCIMTGPWTLYGMPGSLYTAKARSYLRKQGLELVERIPADPKFSGEILPAIGRWIIPVVQTPDGTIVQDGMEIIDHIEARGAATLSAYPADPVGKVIALLFELFGGEGLLRPAMHYRWNFDADNLAFLERDFMCGLNPTASGEDRSRIFAQSSGRMRKAAASFGVNPDTYGAVEASYLDFLARLDAHFALYPYLLGDRPTVGDYGLIGPLHAHLSRDPHPSHIMKARAHNVWRWVERMTTRDADDGEFLARDQKPEPALRSATLAALLAFIAEDYLPEVEAMTRFLTGWLADKTEAELTAVPIARGVGRTSFAWRGHELTVGVAPYRMLLLQRVQDAARSLAPSDSAKLHSLLDPAGLTPLLDLTIPRRVERRQNREWWAPGVA
jgi:glutathione S-transferase